MIKTYSVTLDYEVVEKAKKKLKINEKLSPKINNLLKAWVDGDILLKEGKNPSKSIKTTTGGDSDGI